MSKDSSKPVLSSGDSANKDETKPRWSVSVGLLVAFFAVIGMQIILEIVLSLTSSIFHWDGIRLNGLVASAPGTLATTLAIEIMSVGFIFWFMRRRKADIRKLLGLRNIIPKDIGYAVTAFVVYIVVLAAVYNFVVMPLHLDNGGKQAIGFDEGINRTNLLFAFVSLVVLPPIAEEIIFRGFLYRTLRAHKIRVWGSVFITSLFFGALHLFTGQDSILWVAGIDTFVLSVVLCIVRERTGALWASILIHALKNSLALVSLFLTTV